MSGETRLKATLVWAAAAMLAGIGVVEALEQFGAPPILAAFFPFLPLAIGLVIALTMRSLDFTEMVRGGTFTSEATGWAVAGLLASALVLVAAPMATALGGGSGMLLLLAFLVGAGLSLFLVMPAVRATGAPTLASAIGHRFGTAPRALAAIAIVLSLLPLAAAEASVAGMVAARMLGLPSADGRDGIIALAAIACLFGGARAVIAMAAIAAPIVAIAYLTPVSIVSFENGSLPLPWAGLFEPASFEATTRLPATIFLAVAVCLIAGIGALPTLLLPACTRPRRPARPRHRAVGLAVAAGLLLAGPSYGLLGTGLGIDPTTDPAGLVVHFAEQAGLSASPSVLLIGGLLMAALVAITATLATAAVAIGNDLYVQFVERSAPAGRRIFVTRLAVILLAVLAGILCRAFGDNAPFLAASGLSIAAASLGPLLLIAWHLPRVERFAAVSTISVGLGLTVADIGLAVLLPDVAGRFFGMGAVQPTVLGPTGWFGLPVGLSGLIAIIAAVIVLWAVNELPGTDWRHLGSRSRSATEAAIRSVATAILHRVERRRAEPAAPPSTLADAETADPAPLAPVEALATADTPPSTSQTRSGDETSTIELSGAPRSPDALPAPEDAPATPADSEKG